jgi:hypothetical protein
MPAHGREELGRHGGEDDPPACTHVGEEGKICGEMRGELALEETRLRGS